MQPTEGCQAVLSKGMCEAEPAVGGGDVQADRGGQGALGGEEGVGAGGARGTTLICVEAQLLANF